MKRIFIGIALSMLISNVYASVSLPEEAGYCSESSNVYIEG